MVTRKLPSVGKWLLVLLLALAPLVVSGCRSTGGTTGSDGHAGHSH